MSGAQFMNQLAIRKFINRLSEKMEICDNEIANFLSTKDKIVSIGQYQKLNFRNEIKKYIIIDNVNLTSD